MSLLGKFATVSLFFTLIGCASSVPLYRGQIDTITTNSSPDTVEKTLGVATPSAQFVLTVNDNSYFVRHYALQTGTRQDMTMVCTPVCIPIFINVPITAPYLIVQRLPTRAMHAWGTIEELSKDTEPSISSIMPTLKIQLEAALAEKKK